MRIGNKPSKKQLLATIDELQNRPHDRVRILGDLGISALGAGLGAAAAGTVAAAVGATSIPVVTTAASWIGVTALAATPVGWTIGVAAAGGVLAYGISRLVRSGALSEGRKYELLNTYQDRIREIEARERAQGVTLKDRTQFITSLREVVEKDALPPAKAFELIEAVENGSMPVSTAYRLVSDIIRA